MHSVSRHTVREAIRFVQSIGMVSRRQGLGTRVRSSNQRREYRLSIRTFSDVEQHGYFTHLVGLETRMITADRDLADELPCAAGETYLQIGCYRVPVDDSVPIPMAWNTTYIAARYAAVQAEIGRTEGPVYSLIERMFGERVDEIDQNVMAVPLDTGIAHRLAVRPKSCGLRIKRTYFGRSGEPIMFGYNTYAAAQFALNMRLRHE